MSGRQCPNSWTKPRNLSLFLILNPSGLEMIQRAQAPKITTLKSQLTGLKPKFRDLAPPYPKTCHLSIMSAPNPTNLLQEQRLNQLTHQASSFRSRKRVWMSLSVRLPCQALETMMFSILKRRRAPKSSRSPKTPGLSTNATTSWSRWKNWDSKSKKWRIL